MTRDQVVGLALIVLSVVVAIAITYLLFFPPIEGVDILTLKVIVEIAVVALAGIVGWIGYTLATTPPPKPIEEIEKEIEEELKKLELEAKKEERKQI
ncbi:MAG: transcriptional regulator [Desulfurococcaceae archaeon]|nr:transcriptional regulator [Desulfurococcaceae archaeon]